MNEVYERIVDLLREGHDGALVIVVDKQGHGPARVQTKMLVLSDGRRIGTVGGGALEFAAIKTAGDIIESRQALLRTYSMSPGNQIVEGEDTGMLCGGSITLFYEYVGTGGKVYIFGAGHIGEALVYHLKDLNYLVTLLDNREEVLKKDFEAKKVLYGQCDDLFLGEEIPPGAYFVIATHSHELDYQILRKLYEHDLRLRPKYIGLVASRNKVEVMKKRLANDLKRDPNFGVLFSPAGLNIGGSLPHEIAISIVSEIQAVRHGRDSVCVGSLRAGR